MLEWNPETSPRSKARFAGLVYLLVFVTGGAAFFLRGTYGLVANLIAGACYVVVTLLFYGLFKPVSRSLSLLAAIISLAGCVIGPLSALHLLPARINPLVFFGVYCLLIGYLIFNSTYLPRFLGVLMAFGGLGWLTFASSTLANSLSPFNMFPGVFGEGFLTIWLIVQGVNEQRWKEQALVSRDSRS